MAIRRLSGQGTLSGLIIAYLAAVVSLAGAIWLEWPEWAASVLLTAALAPALLAAVCAGRTFTDWQASISYRERTSTSARSVSVLTFIALSALPIACTKLIYPRSWPTTVEEAVAILSDQLDTQSERDLAYMGYDDLTDVQQTLGVSVREQFGLNRRNAKLLHDCNPEYIDSNSCSMHIILRLWRKVRAELPPSRRLPLEALEKSMERVRFESEKFERVPIRELADFFNKAIRAQLPQDASFAIIHDPAQGDRSVSVSWRAMGTISLREALGVLEEGGRWNVRKAPPNLVLERTDKNHNE